MIGFCAIIAIAYLLIIAWRENMDKLEKILNNASLAINSETAQIIADEYIKFLYFKDILTSFTVISFITIISLIVKYIADKE
jgi:hypothetical protein|tara:strand:- start:238 stop:483 length:246 start_codon:yes stop_codon:yes gene_type:complete